MNATKKGQISFESVEYGSFRTLSEFLACSCGNDVMNSGFEYVPQTYCENPHYECARCEARACVDFELRIINNEK